jgi:hypothetical protein
MLEGCKRAVVKRMGPNKRVASRERPGEMCVRALESDPIRPSQRPESGARGRPFLRPAAKLAFLSGRNDSPPAC